MKGHLSYLEKPPFPAAMKKQRKLQKHPQPHFLIMLSPRSNMPHLLIESAFTLIELLVVIAIIGILAALLLPSLSTSKNKSYKTVDINNLRQIMMATHMYATDYKDILPWPDWGNTTNPGWLYTFNAETSGPARFKAETGLLWNTLKNGKVYMCPMDDTNASLFKNRKQQISSYAMNGAACGFSKENYPAVPLSAIRQDGVAFWETDEKHPHYFNDGANYPKEPVSTRHINGAINAVFNGAVSYIRFDTWNAFAKETNKNCLWCYPNSANGR